MAKKLTIYQIKRLFVIVRSRISLKKEKEDDLKTIELIKSEAIFRGTNIWILVLAILICSLGLNINSTAVIIGAMLISPLMGPIMGAGLSLGIYDFRFFKKSLKNLFIATIFGISTSTLYFLLTPLSQAQSELLARTSPSFFDVFVAFFGGVAGIIAGASSKKGNVIPGVAIATALMPPLCTIGYGIATFQAKFIFGAFYLYTINTVFIGIATLLIVRYLKFPVFQHINSARKKFVHQITYIIIIVVFLPSVYLAYVLASEAIFITKANTFINDNFKFKNAAIIKTDIEYLSDTSHIRVVMLGEVIPEDVLNNINDKMSFYGLNKAKLIVIQDKDLNQAYDYELMENRLKASFLQDLYKRNEEVIIDKNRKIELLEQELMSLKKVEISDNLIKELILHYPEVNQFSLSNSILSYIVNDSIMYDTTHIALINITRYINNEKKSKLEEWIKLRLNIDNLLLVSTQNK